MSASVVPACYDAMKSMDPAAPVASLSEDLVVVEVPSLPYGGTTKSRGEFFGKVVGYTDQRASFRIESSEELSGACDSYGESAHHPRRDASQWRPIPHNTPPDGRWGRPPTSENVSGAR